MRLYTIIATMLLFAAISFAKTKPVAVNVADYFPASASNAIYMVSFEGDKRLETGDRYLRNNFDTAFYMNYNNYNKQNKLEISIPYYGGSGFLSDLSKGNGSLIETNISWGQDAYSGSNWLIGSNSNYSLSKTEYNNTIQKQGIVLKTRSLICIESTVFREEYSYAKDSIQRSFVTNRFGGAIDIYTAKNPPLKVTYSTNKFISYYSVSVVLEKGKGLKTARVIQYNEDKTNFTYTIKRK